MPNPGYDDWMDAQLRNVPVPPELLSRLADTVHTPRPGGTQPDVFDAQGPSGTRLRDALDDQLDAAILSVPVPGYLESRLRRIARQGRPLPLWRQIGMAASLFLMIGLGGAYLAVVTGLVGGKPAPVAQAPGPPTILPHSSSSASPAETSLAVMPVVDERDDAGFDSTEPGDSQATAAEAPAPRVSIPFVRGMATLSTSLRQAIEAKRRSLATLGSGGELDRLPQLDALDAPAPRGITPPRIRGYDLLFQLRHGEHPFVSPAAHADLATTRVPFNLRIASYDSAAARLRGGQLPAADDVHVEDFLAAQHLLLPPAPVGGLALHAAAVQSPLGDPGLHLLQLAVRSGKSRVEPHVPARLVAVIDLSSPMRSGARWQSLGRALVQLADELGPHDHVTLIGFAEQTRVLADSIGGTELRKLVVSETWPEPTGLADLSLAVQAGVETIKALQSGEARHLAFITAGRGDFDDDALEKSAAALAQLVTGGASWQVLYLGSDAPAEPLMQLVDRGQGRLASVDSPVSIVTPLLEKMIGGTPWVAQKASLKLTLNPKIVTSYRLLGHDSATLTAKAADQFEIDFAVDQTTADLFELWIKPTGGEQIGSVELTWHDPANGQARLAASVIRRRDLSQSFTQAPPWLQHGIIAAKGAEVLSGSTYTQNSRPMSHLLELVDQVDPKLAEQASFQSLVEMLRQAEKLR